ncbi:hypothetical protein DPMN_159893 [Dreissena polymorpha]|uniref:C962R-like N-terminal AEP domain-containing protein n=1 Tax=Dreissena polymorpha TaxID=45954 RepID=A0A9D4EQ58_DREPO|nr:hypothetical protein DPMN_159893 [Dreissena polymorpha]
MSAYDKLHYFLMGNRTKESQHYTHVLVGPPFGKNRLNRDYAKFWKLYTSCVEQGDTLCLAEKQYDQSPLLVDVDLMVKKSLLANTDEFVATRKSDTDARVCKILRAYQQTPKIYTNAQVCEIVRAYQETLKSVVKNLHKESLLCVVMEKPFHEKVIDGEMHIKNGLHFHFPQLFIKRKAQESYVIPIVQQRLQNLFANIG